MKNVFCSALPLKLGNYILLLKNLECPIYLKKDQLKKKANYGHLKMADNYKRRVVQTSFCVLAPLT